MSYLNASRKFSLVSTSNVEKAEFCISQSLAKAQIKKITDKSAFRLSINALNFGDTTVICNGFQSECELEAVLGDDDFKFVFGNDKPTCFSWQKKSLNVSQEIGGVIEPSCRFRIERDAFSETVVINTSYSRLKKYYETLSDEHLPASFIFDHNIDLKKSAGAFLKQVLKNLVSEISLNENILKNQGVKRGYDELILGALLALPHNQCDSLLSPRRNYYSPATVKLAEDYMRSHFADPILISDLLKVCRCSRRALFSNFQVSRDYTPMMFLNEQRLQAARKKLMESAPQEDSVSNIAFKCGFLHLGRFPQSYKKRFGELPSETLKK